MAQIIGARRWGVAITDFVGRRKMSCECCASLVSYAASAEFDVASKRTGETKVSAASCAGPDAGSGR
jgi:hypothetical protein